MLAVILFVLALGMTLYPVISNYVNQKYASEIHTAYQEVIQQTDNSELLKAIISVAADFPAIKLLSCSWVNGNSSRSFFFTHFCKFNCIDIVVRISFAKFYRDWFVAVLPVPIAHTGS